MSNEALEDSVPSGQPEETDTRYVRVSIPNLFPHFPETGDEVQLELPEGLDLAAARAEREHTGGQVQSPGHGNTPVEMKAYSLPEWLIKQKDARLVRESGQAAA